MKAPELTDELKERIVDGCEVESGARAFDEWSVGATASCRDSESAERALVSPGGRRLAADGNRPITNK